MFTSLLACGSSDAASTPAAGPAPNAKAAVPAKPTPTIEESSFRLILEADGPFKAGQPANIALELQARGGYHINQDYPIRVDLKSGDPFKLAKTSVTKAEATSFDEQAAVFAVPFVAAKGTHEVAATVDFAVCTKDTCVPDQRTVAIAVPVD